MSEPIEPTQHLRIGNQQREEAISALNDHFAAARLDITEYQNRVTMASEAQSYQQLAELFRDLPQPHPPFLAPPSVPFPQQPPTAQYLPPPTQQYVPPPTGGYQQPPTGGYPQAYAQPPVPGGYGPAGYGPYDAPYGIDPMSGLPWSDKSKVAAGVLQLFVGNLGIGRFYTGHIGIAVAQLLTCGGCGIWSLIDGIIILVNGGTDAQGRRLRD